MPAVLWVGDYIVMRGRDIMFIIYIIHIFHIIYIIYYKYIIGYLCNIYLYVIFSTYILYIILYIRPT